MIWRIPILIFGVLACSTAIIMINATEAAPLPLAAYRQLIAAVILAPLMLRDLRRGRGRLGWPEFRRTLLPGAILALHFISWIIGARRTQVANASLVVNMAPLAMPFFLHVLIRERLTRGEVVGTALGLVGVGVLATADFSLNRGNFVGDAICFGSMLLFAMYLALGRRNRDFASVWVYLVPLYFVGGVLCLACSFLFAAPPGIYTADGWLVAIGLAIVPTVMGHTILNYSMRHIRGQAVGLTNLGQFIFAGTMAYLIWREVPGWAFAVAAPLVVAGAALALKSTPEPPGTPNLPPAD